MIRRKEVLKLLPSFNPKSEKPAFRVGIAQKYLRIFLKRAIDLEDSSADRRANFSLLIGGANRRDNVSSLGSERDFWKLDAQDLAGDLRMPRGDSHNRTLAIDPNPLVTGRIFSIIGHIEGHHRKNLANWLKTPLLRDRLSGEFPSRVVSARQMAYSIKASMKWQRLATDCDGTTDGAGTAVTEIKALIGSTVFGDLADQLRAEASQ
jgi:hypothetical protein